MKLPRFWVKELLRIVDPILDWEKLKRAIFERLLLFNTPPNDNSNATNTPTSPPIPPDQHSRSMKVFDQMSKCLVTVLGVVTIAKCTSHGLVSFNNNLELPTCNINMTLELQHVHSWSCLNEFFHDDCRFILAKSHYYFGDMAEKFIVFLRSVVMTLLHCYLS
jgi:hypothetical protein